VNVQQTARTITGTTLIWLLLVTGCTLAQSQGPTLTTIYSFGTPDPNPLAVGAAGVLYLTGFATGEVYSLTPPTSPAGSWTPTRLIK